MSEDTKRRIIDATLRTLRDHGAGGTSARAISKAGGFNTSLLFYHFGSVEGALLAAARADTEQRNRAVRRTAGRGRDPPGPRRLRP